MLSDLGFELRDEGRGRLDERVTKRAGLVERTDLGEQRDFVLGSLAQFVPLVGGLNLVDIEVDKYGACVVSVGSTNHQPSSIGEVSRPKRLSYVVQSVFRKRMSVRSHDNTHAQCARLQRETQMGIGGYQVFHANDELRTRHHIHVTGSLSVELVERLNQEAQQHHIDEVDGHTHLG